jgi:DNA-binding CsgD family transcriptional regulator
LTQCDRLADDHGLDDPAVLRHEPDLVEALLARNDVQGACLVAARAQERADRLGATWALASAARCRGMLATDTDFAAQFETALVLHDHLPRPFERARIQLAFGERLRRARRRGEARTPLADSLAAFDALGARPWADRAARELRATVVTARRRDFSWDDDLTPQEQRVALILANGATVREAAGQLFLSPKTIEAHLGRAYRKLGVRNRAELASRLLPIDAGALPGVS